MFNNFFLSFYSSSICELSYLSIYIDLSFSSPPLPFLSLPHISQNRQYLHTTYFCIPFVSLHFSNSYGQIDARQPRKWPRVDILLAIAICPNTLPRSSLRFSKGIAGSSFRVRVSFAYEDEQDKWRSRCGHERKVVGMYYYFSCYSFLSISFPFFLRVFYLFCKHFGFLLFLPFVQHQRSYILHSSSLIFFCYAVAFFQLK